MRAPAGPWRVTERAGGRARKHRRAGRGPVPPAQGVAAAAGLGPSAACWGRRPAPPGGPTPSGCPPARRAAAERPARAPARWAGLGWAGCSRRSLSLPFPGPAPPPGPLISRREAHAVPPGCAGAAAGPGAAPQPHYLARPRLTRRCRVPLAAAPASARPAPPTVTVRRGTMTSLRRPLASGARRRPGRRAGGGEEAAAAAGGAASASGSHGDRHRPCAAAGSR